MRSDRGIPNEAIRFSTRHFTRASTRWLPNVRAVSFTPDQRLESGDRVLGKALAGRPARGTPHVPPFLLDAPQFCIAFHPMRWRVLDSGRTGIAPGWNRRYRAASEDRFVARAAVVGSVLGDLADRTGDLVEHRRKVRAVVDPARCQIDRVGSILLLGVA